MPLIEQPVSGREIDVPPRLPMILKQFCKAAIRTQPYDLLRWSSAYFRALADGEEPPAKLRLEYPPPSTASGLTLGFLRVLLRQFGDYNKMLSVETISRRWECLCLDRKELNLIMMIGKFRRKCQVKKFLAIAVGLLGSSLFDTMIMICELFTHEPDGGSAMVPVTLFMEIYGYLAGLRCDGSERDSSDEDPEAFIIWDETINTVSPKTHEATDTSKLPLDRMCSVTSQDTEADINLELDLTSKDDGESSKNSTSRLTENNPRGNDRSEKTEESSSGQTLKGDGSNDNSATEVDKSVSTRRSSDEQDSSNAAAGRRATNTEQDDIVRTKDGQTFDRKKRKMKISDTRLLKYHPDIPGIGGRLSADEVASVAIWMSECARLQEGMVGPRNLRHIQCPPLDRQRSSDS